MAAPAGIVEYLLPGGWCVLAGRTDAANDHLSLTLARAGDLWFHIRGMPGSHVILRVPPGGTPDRATRELAASIAAYHSKARSAGTVAVTIRKETVLKVRPLSEEALAALQPAGEGP
jgi:predicted ribosome quality control (RQC) complex YloA/Tae2 family protein